MLFKSLLLWLPMIVIAIANGTLRQFVLGRHFKEMTSHQLSTITLIVLCSCYTLIIFPYLQISQTKQAFLVGAMWTLWTIIFEFALGRLTKKSWLTLVQQYDITAGYLWPVFLLWLLLLPFLIHIIRK